MCPGKETSLCLAEVVLYSQKCDFILHSFYFVLKFWGSGERKGRMEGLGCFLTAFRKINFSFNAWLLLMGEK